MITKKAKTQTITVKANSENPEPLEVLAKSIIDVADAFKKINNSQLKRRTVIILLQDMTGISQTQIGKILDAAPLLKETYLKSV